MHDSTDSTEPAFAPMCAVRGCVRDADAGNICRKHLHMRRLHGVAGSGAASPSHPGFCRVNGCRELCFSERYCLAHEVRYLRILEKHQVVRERNERTRAALVSAANRITTHSEMRVSEAPPARRRPSGRAPLSK
jgi:hypothetical protein